MPDLHIPSSRWSFAALFSRSARVLGWVFSAVALAGVLLSTLDHGDLLPASFILYGIDYVPTTAIAVLIVPGVVLLVCGGRWRYGSVLMVICAIYAIGLGDISWTSLSVRNPGLHAATPTLRVLALNVQYYTHGVDSVASALQRSHADVILLSENAFDDPEDERRLIALMAPMHFVQGHPNSTAILSRYPIQTWAEVELPSFEASLSGGNTIAEVETHIRRSFVHAVLDVDGGDVNIISIRFIAGRPKDHSVEENIKWGRYLMTVQLGEEEFFENYVRALRAPVIFGGDLNAPPGSKVLRRINRFAQDAYLVDHLWGEPTFRTEAPTLRLDYIFATHGAETVHSELLSEHVSDHFPVCADIVLVPRGEGEGAREPITRGTPREEASTYVAQTTGGSRASAGSDPVPRENEHVIATIPRPTPRTHR